MTQLFNKYAVGSATIIFLATLGYAGRPITEILLPGTRVFPESITSTGDGTLIVGSWGHNNVLRIAPGKPAEEWIKAGAGGLNQVLGVFADEKGKTLWVCSNRMGMGEPTSAKAFDLKTGEPKGSYPFPGNGAFCNDFAAAADGTIYATDTRQSTILMLKPGGKDLEIAAKDPLLAGADGLAFGEKMILYVNTFGSGKLLRLDLGEDGKAKSVAELKLSRPLDGRMECARSARIGCCWPRTPARWTS